MNGKRAKALRRRARENCPENLARRDYDDYQPPGFEVHYFTDPNTGVKTNHVTGVSKIYPGRSRVLDRCERREYKDLKDPNRVERRERNVHV